MHTEQLPVPAAVIVAMVVSTVTSSSSSSSLVSQAFLSVRGTLRDLSIVSTVAFEKAPKW